MSDTVPNGLESAIGQDVQDYASQNPLAAAAPMVGVPQNQVQPPAPLTSNSFLQAATNPLVQQPTLSDSTGVSPSIRTQIAQQADKLAAANPNPNAPGAWAKNLIGGVQSALANVGNIGEVPNGAGPLYGIGKVLQGQQQQKAQASQNARADALAQSEVERNHQLTLNENAQMMHQEHLDAYADEDRLTQRNKSANDTLSMITSGPDAAPIIAKDVPYSQVQTLLAQNKLKGFDDHALPTGREQVGEKDGQPVYEPRYTLVGDRPNVDVAVDKPFVDRYNKAFPSEDPLQEGTKIPYRSLLAKEQEITNSEAAQYQRDKATEDINKGEDDIKKAQEARSFGSSPEWVNALGQAGGDEHKALAALLSNADAVKKFPNATQDAMAYYYGPKAWEELGKERETQRHDEETEDLKRIDENAKAAKAGSAEIGGNTELDGEAYLNSLTGNDKAMIQAMGTGRMPLGQMARIASGKDGQKVLTEVAKAYPEFDASKISGYGKLVQDFTTGKSSDQMQAINVVLPHLDALYSAVNSNPAGVLPGINWAEAKMGSDTVSMINTAKTQASQELAGAYAKGAITNEEHETFKKELDTNSPWELRKNIVSIIDLLESKQNGLKQKWSDGAPSAQYRPPRQIIDADAQGALDHIQLLNSGVKNPPPAQALSHVQTGFITEFKDGSKWTRQDGKPVQVSPPTKKVQ